MRSAYVLFGVRSPLVVEYEETLGRLGQAPVAAVSVNGAPRVLDHSLVLEFNSMSQRERERLAARAGFITCAFASLRRQQLCAIALDAGFHPAAALCDPTAVLPRSLRVRAGTFINAAAVVGSATFIGAHTLVNRAVSIGHHCMIGDFVSIGPGATLASNIRVGDGATIGVGATVVPNISIGRNAVVGAGSLVRNDVPDDCFVAGHPATERPLDRERSGLNTAGEE
ncbi:MAG: acetyltransferase [Halioglobus sp.]|nr:acetyltransferase [Halioglobus sp.]